MKSFRAQLVVLVAIALVTVAPSLLRPGSMAGDGVDAWGTWWFYWWIRQCIEHFGNPGWTNFFFFPLGKDILSHTGNNFVDAVWSVPFQWIFGPDHYYPLFMAFLLVGNALSIRPLAREVLGEDAVWPASLLFLVNPYALFEITAGRPTQAMLWWIPIATVLFLRTVRGGTVRDAIFFGIAVAVAGWTYWFQIFFLGFLFVALLPFELRSRRGAALIGLAAVVTVVLVLPALVPMAQAWQAGDVPGEGTGGGSIFEMPKAVANNVSAELQGLWLMEREGSPLFTQPAWILGLGLALFRARLGRWWLGLGVLLLFAIGPAWRHGDTLTPLPWYLLLFYHVPFFRRLWFPYRMAGVAFTVATLLVTAALPKKGRGLALAGLVILGLGGQFWYGVWPANWRDTRCPEVLVALRGEKPEGVIFLPMRIQHEGLLWQTRFALPTFGGMGESAPVMFPPGFRQRLDLPAIKAMRAASMSAGNHPAIRPEDFAAVRQEGFRWVVLRRDLVEGELERAGKGGTVDEVVFNVVGTMGRRADAVDGALLLWDLDAKWTVPPRFAATPENLQKATWEKPGPPGWAAGLAARGRLGRTPETREGPTQAPKKPR